MRILNGKECGARPQIPFANQVLHRELFGNLDNLSVVSVMLPAFQRTTQRGRTTYHRNISSADSLPERSLLAYARLR